MSLVTYRISIESKASGRAHQTGRPQTVGVPTIASRLRNMFAAVVSIFDAIAEARVQKA